MRTSKHRAASALMGALLFALGLIAGVCVAPAEDPAQVTSNLENPVIATIDPSEVLFALTSEQVKPELIPEYTNMEYLLARTTDRAMYIPAEYMPAMVDRYSGIEMSSYELWEMAAIIQLESGNQPPEGQQAVAEVIFNRVLHEGFPNTVHDVIHDDGGIGVIQFTTSVDIDKAEPTEEQFDAIFAALHGNTILPKKVVFFSRDGENDRVWGKIGDHVFCYEYDWEN